jgi:hypothetical protein
VRHSIFTIDEEREDQSSEHDEIEERKVAYSPELSDQLMKSGQEDNLSEKIAEENDDFDRILSERNTLTDYNQN